MKEVNYHSKSVKDLFKEFETSEKGLSKNQVEKRLEEYGQNVIKKKKKI